MRPLEASCHFRDAYRFLSTSALTLAPTATIASKLATSQKNATTQWCVLSAPAITSRTSTPLTSPIARPRGLYAYTPPCFARTARQPPTRGTPRSAPPTPPLTSSQLNKEIGWRNENSLFFLSFTYYYEFAFPLSFLLAYFFGALGDN